MSVSNGHQRRHYQRPSGIGKSEYAASPDTLLLAFKVCRVNLTSRPSGDNQSDCGSAIQREMTRLSAMELSPSIDKQQLMTEVFEEIIDVSKISQGLRGTCAVAAAIIAATLNNPSQTVKLIADLASPAGKAQLLNGEWIFRNEKWHVFGAGQTLPQRLLQPALMDFGAKEEGRARGKLSHYDIDLDERIVDGVPDGSGMPQEGIAAIMTGLEGKPWDSQGVLTTPASIQDREDLMASIVALASRRPVPVSIMGLKVPHAIVVESIADGMVAYLDPQVGRLEMPVEDLRLRVLGFVYPRELATLLLRKPS